jgi:hypothetical protein
MDSDYPETARVVDLSDCTVTSSRNLVSLGRFLLACSRIEWQLRAGTLLHTLARIERRRLRARSRGSILDLTHGSKLIAIFKRLRPLYPRPYLCLFESLAQLEFLASFGLFPQLVFGVVADPFQAHCWLQEGPVVLNDDLERVQKFKPILSV